jgi:signal transduction histidine kinase
LQPHYCDFSVDSKTNPKNRSYCYPIFYRDHLYALFRFFLKPGKEINWDQQEILANIQDEVIISLMAGQDRIRISEVEVAESALAERHSLSNYLHDHLGQNLGYLRMKLEQFVNQPELISNSEEFKADLKRMKDVVDESYRTVRSKLEVTIPDSTPLLTNYLHEHAKKVATRSNIDVNFLSRGISRIVPVELQRAVFFVFQEALSNVEKHSHASHVDILLEWDTDHLTISVIDNGTGFNIDKVSTRKHFGLEIMRERMAGIGGSIKIISSENAGTILKIFAPLPVGKKQERTIQNESR